MPLPPPPPVPLPLLLPPPPPPPVPLPLPLPLPLPIPLPCPQTHSCPNLCPFPCPCPCPYQTSKPINRPTRSLHPHQFLTPRWRPHPFITLCTSQGQSNASPDRHKCMPSHALVPSHPRAAATARPQQSHGARAHCLRSAMHLLSDSKPMQSRPRTPTLPASHREKMPQTAQGQCAHSTSDPRHLSAVVRLLVGCWEDARGRCRVGVGGVLGKPFLDKRRPRAADRPMPSLAPTAPLQGHREGPDP